MRAIQRFGAVVLFLVSCRLGWASSEINSVAVNPITNKVYTASRSYSTSAGQYLGYVTVVDGSTNAVLVTIQLPTYLVGQIAVNPNTNKVYVADDSRFIVIDGNTNAIVATFQNGYSSGNPIGVAVDPADDIVYGGVSYGSAYNLVIADGSSDTVTGYATIDQNAFDMAFDSGTSQMIVVSIDNYLRLVNVSDPAHSYVKVPTSHTPTGAIFDSASGNVLYASANGGRGDPNLLNVYDTAGSQQSYLLSYGDNGTYGIGVNSVTELAYVSSGSGPGVTGHVQVFNLSTKQPVTSIETPGFTYSPNLVNVAVNETTNRIYAGNGDNGTVSVIDGATNTVIQNVIIP